MAKSEEAFEEALKGKKYPVLILDNKWHRLFTQRNQSKEIKDTAEELKALVGKQGGLNNDIKDIKRLKQKLMDEIVSGIDDTPLTDKEMDEHKRLIEECNEKVEQKQDELLDLPRDIEKVNMELMLDTMEICYDQIADNTARINEISDWIAGMRIELKKNVVRKQEAELKNQQIYSYMHDIFGAEVIDIFDMKYNPETEHVVKPTGSSAPANDKSDKKTPDAATASNDREKETEKTDAAEGSGE